VMYLYFPDTSRTSGIDLMSEIVKWNV
jgi:hypothetical protein